MWRKRKKRTLISPQERQGYQAQEHWSTVWHIFVKSCCSCIIMRSINNWTRSTTQNYYINQQIWTWRIRKNIHEAPFCGCLSTTHNQTHKYAIIHLGKTVYKHVFHPSWHTSPVKYHHIFIKNPQNNNNGMDYMARQRVHTLQQQGAWGDNAGQRVDGAIQPPPDSTTT